ncbi:MAG: radical SAM protein [Endomicrobiaceae bacterium]|nr:radical SAM protein [Endomicrobiaceae bacterium]
MKTALIKAPWWVRYCPPYILAYFSTYLKSLGHSTFCFDLNNIFYHQCTDENKKYWDNRDFYSVWENNTFTDTILKVSNAEKSIRDILSTGAQVFIFDTHTPSVNISYALAKKIKSIKPDSVIIFMGHKASKAQMAYDFAEQNFIDYVCYGEADIPLKNLLQKLDEGFNIKDLPVCKGFLVKLKGKVTDCGSGDFVKDLDSLPIPDYSDFREDILNNKYSQPNRLDLLDSRGCINACHFCYERLFWPGYRAMSGDKLFEQIVRHMRDFPQINYFYFNGLLLNGNLKNLETFCDLIIKNGVKVSWAGQAVVRDDMPLELLKKMKKAGCGWVGYGVESGSQDVLDAMNKRFTVQKAVELFKNTKEAGISFQINMMCGFPVETEEDFCKTLNFLTSARPYVDSILASQSFFTLEKGTYVRNNPEKFGITKADHHLFWKSKNNDYPLRFERYEKFCNLALKLKYPETSGISAVKPDKWFLLGEYYFYDKNYSKSRQCFEKSFEKEFKSKEICSRLISIAKQMKDTNLEEKYKKELEALS